MDILGNIGHVVVVAITFLVVFSVLIIIHELGHFWVARMTGVKVEEFGFGLPPKIWAKKTKRTVEILQEDGKKKKVKEDMLWTINAIPFGGFVRMYGEDTDEGCKDDPRAFCNRPLLFRMLVTLAGVTMNLILAFILFTLVAWTGYEPIVDPNLSNSQKFDKYFSDGHLDEWIDLGFYKKFENGAYVVDLDPNGPGAEAGIQKGDNVVRLNGTLISSPNDFRDMQQGMREGEIITYEIERYLPEENNMESVIIEVLPVLEEDNILRIGVSLVNTYYMRLEAVEYSFIGSVAEAYHSSRRYVVLSVDMVGVVLKSTLGKIFTGKVPSIPDEVGGPVAIASTTNRLVELGDFSKILQFAAILSLSLAVINLVPFPALDGGRFFFQVLEMIFFILIWPIRKLRPNCKLTHRIPPKWEMPLHLAGYALLLLFIVAVTFQDIMNIFS